MTQSILSSLFSLPPPGHRTVPALAKLCFAQTKSQGRYDNIFIYYSVFRTSYLVGFLFFLLNVLSRIAQMPLNFYFFTIDLMGDRFVKTFLESYTCYTVTTLLFVVIPYYLVVWSNNFDNMVCSIHLTRGRRKDLSVARFIYVYGICIITIIPCMYEAFGLFGLAMHSNHYEDSYVYFLFCGMGLPAFLAILNIVCFMVLLSFFFSRSQSTSENQHKIT